MMVHGTQIEIDGRIMIVIAYHTAVHDMIGDRSGEVHLEEYVIKEEDLVIVIMRDQAVARNSERDLQCRRCHTKTSEGEVGRA